MARGKFILALWTGWLALGLSASAFAGPDVGLGVNLKMLIPNNLPNFRTSVTAYGPSVSLLSKPHSVETQLSYGSNDGVTVYLAELSYRYEIDTPFFTFYLLTGAHYLFYSPLGAAAEKFPGIHFGPGVVLRFGSRVLLPLSIRVHFQKQSMIAAGGGLVFLL